VAVSRAGGIADFGVPKLAAVAAAAADGLELNTFLEETADAKSLAGIAAIKTAGVLQVPPEVWGLPSKTTTGRDSSARKCQCRHRTWLQLAKKTNWE
jgi:hypothetical protein